MGGKFSHKLEVLLPLKYFPNCFWDSVAGPILVLAQDDQQSIGHLRYVVWCLSVYTEIWQSLLGGNIKVGRFIQYGVAQIYRLINRKMPTVLVIQIH